VNEQKHWWLLQRRNSKDSPLRKADSAPHEWYTLRRYSDLDRARRGKLLDGSGNSHIASYFEWQIVDEKTGEVAA
jgi:hypothetical protein